MPPMNILGDKLAAAHGPSCKAFSGAFRQQRRYVIFKGSLFARSELLGNSHCLICLEFTPSITSLLHNIEVRPC